MISRTIKPKSAKVSLRQIGIAAACILILFGVASIFVVSAVSRSVQHNVHDGNRILTRKIDSLEERLETLEKEITHLTQKHKELQKHQAKLGVTSLSEPVKPEQAQAQPVAVDVDVASTLTLGDLDAFVAELNSQPKVQQRRKPDNEQPTSFKPAVVSMKKMIQPATDQQTQDDKIAAFAMMLNRDFVDSEHLRTMLGTHYFMIVGISTMPRVTSAGKPLDYLKQTVNSLKQELEKYKPKAVAVGKPVLIYVQFPYIPNSKEHAVFDELRREYKGDVDILLFHNPVRFMDPFMDIPGHNYLSFENTIPGGKARQQNCDVISIAETVSNNFDFDHFMFLEDDFVTCDRAFEKLERAIRKIEKKNMCALRASYGMAGVIFPKKVLGDFATYMEENIDLLPVDVLAREFHFSRGPRYLGETKSKFCVANSLQAYTYRDVLHEHIGHTSTFEERNKDNFRPAFPQCLTPMAQVWNLSGEERFKPNCADVEVSPCN